MSAVPDGSVALVVTSPPYPMIELWDEQFAAADTCIATALSAEHGIQAFELMHTRLDEVWRECHRVLQPGGLACINIGDATPQVRRRVPVVLQPQPYPSGDDEAGILRAARHPVAQAHQRAQQVPRLRHACPAGAYVTYEHEYILIVRKGGPRKILVCRQGPPPTQRLLLGGAQPVVLRACGSVWSAPARFWAKLDSTIPKRAPVAPRSRSNWPTASSRCTRSSRHCARPIPWHRHHHRRRIASGRASIGFEIEHSLANTIRNTVETAGPLGREYAQRRLQKHIAFVHSREEAGRPCRHVNRNYGFAVVTRQETDLALVAPNAIEALTTGTFSAQHERAAAPICHSQIELPFASTS